MTPDPDPPPLEREHDVEVPQRQRLNRKVHDAGRVAQFAEAEDPLQLPHAGGRFPAVCGQTFVERRKARCALRYADRLLEELTVSPQRPLPGARPIEPGSDPTGKSERQHDADDDRHQPETGLGQPRFVHREQYPDRAGQRQDRRLQQPAVASEERLALGPGQEPLDVLERGRRRGDPVRGEVLAPPGQRRERGHCLLTPLDILARRAGQQPVREPACPHRRGRRPEQLIQGGAAEEVQIGGVRMPIDDDPWRRVRARQAIPGAIDPGEATGIDQQQRVQPGDPILDARVPHDQPGEHDEEHAGPGEQRHERAAAECQDEQRQRREDGQQAQA